MATRLRDLVKQSHKLAHITDVDELMKALSKELNLSLAQIVANLVPEEQELILSGLDMDNLKYDWNFWGRPSQIPPEDNSWHLYAMTAGRGAGKTRAGAEWINRYANAHPKSRIALVGRTAADVRDVMTLGDSGIVTVAHPERAPTYFSSKRSVVWPNGSEALMFSSEEPDQLRGPQFSAAWADEVAAWKYTVDDSGINMWMQLTIATRLGDNPQIFATTTPKRTPFMFDLLEQEKTDSGVIVVRGSTMDNAGNLSATYIDRIKSLYDGTRLAEQELYGIMLENVEGALWDEDILREARILNETEIENLRNQPLKIISVDPSVAENPTDECGIIVAGATNHRKLSDRHAYVIEDASIQGSPSEWANKVVEVWERHKCPVVVEVNQGGALVKNSIHAINADVPILEVRAHQGKALRAEPVTLKYDQKKVHHLGVFAELESQLTSWIPGETRKSPDRVDALVYAIIALLIKPPKKFGARPMRAKSASSRRLPKHKLGH